MFVWIVDKLRSLVIDHPSTWIVRYLVAGYLQFHHRIQTHFFSLCLGNRVHANQLGLVSDPISFKAGPGLTQDPWESHRTGNTWRREAKETRGQQTFFTSIRCLQLYKVHWRLKSKKIIFINKIQNTFFYTFVLDLTHRNRKINLAHGHMFSFSFTFYNAYLSIFF